MWAFFVADATLVGTAVLIAQRSGERLSPTATWAIVGCVFAGALIGLVPLLLRFERQKNETLDDRQRALEALAQTVTSSAEQISVAASGLHGIVELVQKNLKHAEQLPHKLQDKVAEFQAQLANVSDGEKEEMEKELVALRSSETERLESVSDKIAKAVAELAKLEAASRQHLASANDATAKLALGTASAIGKTQVAAEQALSQARTEAARALEASRAAALADFDAHVTRQLTALDEKISRLEAVLRQAPAAAPTVAPSSPPAAAEPEPAATVESPAATEASAATPKRPRKPRRDEPAPTETATAAEPEANGSVIAASSETATSNGSHAEPGAAAPEPAPIAAGRIPEVTPVVPLTTAPFVLPASATATAAPDSAPATVEDPPAEAPRKRAPRKPAADAPPEPTLGLEIEDSPRTSAGSVESTSLTSDGATRLLVTAYIGIGNRLFIRGEGPGLSWEKGVPLQFISIGKWRWETNDAGGPVRFKLFKNDESECTALGAQSLDPGHQQEVTAAF